MLDKYKNKYNTIIKVIVINYTIKCNKKLIIQILINSKE